MATWVAKTCRRYTVCIVYFHTVMCSVGFDIISNCSMHGQGLFKIAKYIFQTLLKNLTLSLIVQIPYRSPAYIFYITGHKPVMHMRYLFFISYYTLNTEVYINMTQTHQTRSIRNVITTERMSRTEHCRVVWIISSCAIMTSSAVWLAVMRVKNSNRMNLLFQDLTFVTELTIHLSFSFA
jgi:hypothetical protein